jgi:hypothetical protein
MAYLILVDDTTHGTPWQFDLLLLDITNDDTLVAPEQAELGWARAG